jgi:hypothetical protein
MLFLIVAAATILASKGSTTAVLFESPQAAGVCLEALAMDAASAPQHDPSSASVCAEATVAALSVGVEVEVVKRATGMVQVKVLTGKHAGKIGWVPEANVEDSDPGSLAAPLPAQPTPLPCRTLISEKDLDKTLYTAIKDIKVSKKWYGSTSEMYGHLAEKARKNGADAVISVHTWFAPSGFAWAAPHAGGMAIKWTDAGRKALPSLEGRCY